MKTLRNLFRFWPFHVVIPRASAPPVPFRPFSPVALSPEQIRDALAGQGDNFTVAAIIQILESQICVAVREMSDGVDGARGTYRQLTEFYEGLLALIGGREVATK